MTVEEHWKVCEALVAPEKRSVARVAFYAGYASALADAERYEESLAVMVVLREGKP